MIFKDHLLQAHEQSIPKSRKSGRIASRPVWLNEELLFKLSHRKGLYKAGSRDR